MPVGRARVSRHGQNHIPGGSDPIPGFGSGGGGISGILLTWSGYVPIAAGTSTTRRIPYDADGGSLTFTLDSLFMRIETSQASTVTVRLEHYSSTSAFSPATIATVSVSAGAYEGTNTTSFSVSSGDKVRMVHTAVPVAPTLFEVQLEGAV